MYEKEINLIDVSFIFHSKLASRECHLRVPKMLKIDFGGGWQAVPCPWLYGPGFLDCWAVDPWVNNSKMITASINMALGNGGFLHYTDMKKFLTIFFSETNGQILK